MMAKSTTTEPQGTDSVAEVPDPGGVVAGVDDKDEVAGEAEADVPAVSDGVKRDPETTEDGPAPAEGPPPPPLGDDEIREWTSRRKKMRSLSHLLTHSDAIPGCAGCMAALVGMTGITATSTAITVGSHSGTGCAGLIRHGVLSKSDAKPVKRSDFGQSRFLRL